MYRKFGEANAGEHAVVRLEGTHMRPFSTWSEPAIRSAATQAAQRVLDLLADFKAVTPLPSTGAGAVAYCEELHRLLEALAREERRIEGLADELRLREHWRDVRSR